MRKTIYFAGIGHAGRNNSRRVTINSGRGSI